MSSSLYKQLGFSGAGSPLTGRHLALLILCAGLLALTVFVVHPNEFRIQSFFAGSSSSCPGPDAPAAAAVSPHDAAATATEKEASARAPDDDDDVRVLIGIQTLPSKRARRHLLRDVYSLQAQEHPSVARSVDVRFVFCNVTSADDAVFVALEAIRYGDIIVLDCAENMDNGKTYTFFSTVARAFNGSGSGGDRQPSRSYDYVMKADDDTYLRLPALVESLRGAAREDAYYGLQMPCDTENFYPFPPFMSGMGYALSWDLVQWVASSDLARREQNGPEDMWTGRWLNLAGKGKNRYDNAPRMYNYKGSSPDSCFRHGFVPDTIAVHMLKDDARWAETLAYFNATAGLPSSGGLYHLPVPAAASP